MDSNHRKRKLADLQSAPFGHSGTPPIISFPIQKPYQRTLRSEWECKIKFFFLIVKYSLTKKIISFLFFFHPSSYQQKKWQKPLVFATFL